MTKERELEQERRQLIEAIEWVDSERKRRRTGAAGDVWLYERRCETRVRLGKVNEVLKELRRANSGRVSEGFGMLFFEVAKARLPADVFGELVSAAETVCAERGVSVDGPEKGAESVLDGLRRGLKELVGREVGEKPGTACRASQAVLEEGKETQADFGILKSGTKADEKGISRLEVGGAAKSFGNPFRQARRAYG